MEGLDDEPARHHIICLLLGTFFLLLGEGKKQNPRPRPPSPTPPEGRGRKFRLQQILSGPRDRDKRAICDPSRVRKNVLQLQQRMRSRDKSNIFRNYDYKCRTTGMLPSIEFPSTRGPKLRSKYSILPPRRDTPAGPIYLYNSCGICTSSNGG